MEVQQVLEAISLKEKEIKSTVDIDKPIVFDVGNMTIWDPDTMILPKAGKAREEYVRKLARDNVQVALNQMYSRLVDGDQFLELPEGTTIIPRAKPLPKPKEKTKWERFAEKKNIKSNREKNTWDETTNKWVPRYGYQKVRNEYEKDWCIEIPDGADPSIDYFAKKNEEKKERKAKNKFQQLRNIVSTNNKHNKVK